MVVSGALVDLDTAALRKERGAFFTPEPIARYVTDWAVRSADDHVLEPSCGEAAFLLAGVERLTALSQLAGHAFSTGVLDGVELHAPSAKAAQSVLDQAQMKATITTADFFTVAPTGSYDAVIGNPPYIRYQEFSGEARTRSRAAALRGGVSLTGLASSWAAFTVHAAQFLKPGGRLGLVLPAELLSVNYATDVRTFLMRQFAHVDLVVFTERVFPGVQEEVVLLLADDYQAGPTDYCRIFPVQDAAALSDEVSFRTWWPIPPGGKWTSSLLSNEAAQAYAASAATGAFAGLETWGDTTLGMVTGNNRYFALSEARVRELGLQRTDLIRLSPPGSRHLRGLTFTQAALSGLVQEGASTWLFRPAGEPSAAGQAYIQAGEALDVHKAYKCRVRKPWWRTPLLKPADLLLTYMNADTPRLCSNAAAVHHLNSVHGIYLQPEVRDLGVDLLPLASINAVTLLGAEMVGRSYGGGMLKIEPKEADLLPVPSPDVVRAAQKALTDVRPQVGRFLRSSKLLDAARLVDDVLLIGELGMARGDVKAVREGHAAMTARRGARGGKSRVSR